MVQLLAGCLFKQRHTHRVALCGLALIFSSQVSAQEQMPQAPKAPTVDSIAGQSSAAAASPSFQAPDLSGDIKLTLLQAEAQDEDAERRRDSGEAEVELTLQLDQKLGNSVNLVSRLRLSTLRYSETELNNDDEEFAYDLERLYLDFSANNGWRLRAGRQGISDAMKTIADENLDGLLIAYLRGRTEWSLSYTRQDWFEASTVAKSDEPANILASVKFSPNQSSVWMPYVLHRADVVEDSSAASTWLGLQGLIEPDGSPLRYWVHGSMLDGENDETEELGGFAVDLGINWSLVSNDYKPTFTFAVARASGSERDNRFRQSRLHSNNFALNGKNRFRYLGEVVDPELTNMQIVTLGAGFELSERFMSDLALHWYQQVSAEDRLRGADIEYSPQGADKDLGIGVDLVVSYTHDERFSTQFTTGAFLPGKAFEVEGVDDRKHAWITKLELQYRF